MMIITKTISILLLSLSLIRVAEKEEAREVMWQLEFKIMGQMLNKDMCLSKKIIMEVMLIVVIMEEIRDHKVPNGYLREVNENKGLIREEVKIIMVKSDID